MKFKGINFMNCIGQFDDGNYKLIEKYENYYIRFLGGSMMPLPCDLKISKIEKEAIVLGSESIEDIIRKYMKEIPWTEKEFIDRGFRDFLSNVYGLNEKEIGNVLERLEKNKALKNEMYISIMNEEFPKSCWAKINGKTAKEYAEEQGITYYEAYMYMLEKL